MKKTKRREDGQGSVFEMKPGKWRAQLPYHTRDGKRHYHTKSFPTRTKADAWLTAQRHDRYEGVKVTPDRQTIASYMDVWLTLQTHLSPKSYRNYSDDIENHIKPGLGHIRVQELTTLDVRRWLASKKKLAFHSVKNMRDTLRAALNQAVPELIKFNPVLGFKLKEPKDKQTAADTRGPMEPKEALRLLDALEAHPQGVLFRITLSLGLRKGEALGLKLTDLLLDAEPPTLHVRRTIQKVGGKLIEGKPKTLLSNRVLPLSPLDAAALRLQLKRRDEMKREAGDAWVEMGFVFTTQYGTPADNNLRRTMMAVLAKAGLRHFTVHDLRHAAATFAVADGQPAPYVQAMLGHSDVRTTLALYANKPLPVVLQQTTSTLDRLVARTARD